MADSPLPTSPAALAAHYLWKASRCHERTREVLDSLRDILDGLQGYGPTVQCMERLRTVIARLERENPLPCEVKVTVEGRDVVIRIGCVE